MTLLLLAIVVYVIGMDLVTYHLDNGFARRGVWMSTVFLAICFAVMAYLIIKDL